MMKPRVMIIDDSLTVRMDLGEAFREVEYDVVLCANVQEARESLRLHAPDLIVLDVVLPDVDGVEFLAELRESPVTRDIPVILLSSEAEVKDRIRGLTQGANEYVAKPYDIAYVLARASRLLRPLTPAADAASTVLVIDDSLTYREELAEELVRTGYRCLCAASGLEGLRRAVDLRPDAIIVDGVMPEMDGPEFIRRIRMDPGLSATPCLLLTASEAESIEVMALDSGADTYVRKGEGLDVVLARLGAMLRTSKQSRDRAHAASVMGPKRILAVDDSLTYLNHLADQLRVEGYEVVKAQSGEEALELLTVEEVDCILLDLVMPGMSGTEACRRIKNSAVLRNIPLIMLTALDERSSMIEGINAGADDYIAKSATFDVIRARLRAQLRRKQFEDENRRIRDQLLRNEAETHAARKIAEARKDLLERLSIKNEELAFHVSELERLNGELETFAYSVSHDLRQPLRGMDGFSKVLLERYHDSLDDDGRRYLNRIRSSAKRMGELIDGILALSRVSQRPLVQEPVALDGLAAQVVSRLSDAEPDRVVSVEIQPNLNVVADPHLMESVLENLIGNAWKFTGKQENARVEVGAQAGDLSRVFYVRDNGAGFDMAYAQHLFGPFQRLHSQAEFRGTGIGLATVQRILHRHGGRVWAESRPNEGATFFFSLWERGSGKAPVAEARPTS